MHFRLLLLTTASIASSAQSPLACDLIPFAREPTVAEKVGGLDLIFGGTVIGYKTKGGQTITGPLPPQCLNEDGTFRYYAFDDEPPIAPECTIYLDAEAAVFRVDTAIVGPAAGETATYAMNWGDGDCDIDFQVGDQWLIAGFYFTQELKEPIRPDEVIELRRLAALPEFDFSTIFWKAP